MTDSTIDNPTEALRDKIAEILGYEKENGYYYIAYEIGTPPVDDRLDEIMTAIAQAKEAWTAEAQLKELETLESKSDCIDDGCGLDAELLRHNLLNRLTELREQASKTLPPNQERTN